MGPGARGRDAASSTQGQRSPEAVHSGVPRGSGPPKADVSAHQAFLPVSSGLLLGQQGAGWQGGWWGHSQPQAAPGSGRGATGVGGGAPGQAREDPPPESHRTNRPPGAHSSSRPPRPSVFPIAASLPEPSRVLPTHVGSRGCQPRQASASGRTLSDARQAGVRRGWDPCL